MTTQIELTDSQYGILHSIAKNTGKTEDELVTEAVNKFISEMEKKDLLRNGRHQALMSVAGAWKNREDFSEFEALRNEVDRFPDWSDKGVD